MPRGKASSTVLAGALGVAHLGHEGQHVVAAAQVVIEPAGLGQKLLEIGAKASGFSTPSDPK